VTPLQIAREYATMGSYGIYRPLSITKVTPPVMGQQIADPNIVKTVVRMMESDVLPGGSGVRAAVPGYRLATKTGTAEKLGDSGKYDGGYVNYTAGVARSAILKWRWWWWSTIRRQAPTLVDRWRPLYLAISWGRY
jgi:cell division protein FtsI (penicillin-binding protein 3)